MSTATDSASSASDFRVGKWSATLTVMLGMMSTILSSTMINVAIPDIMGTFGIGQDRAHWMSTGFLAAMTCTMLLNAWFVRNLGVRNTFVMAMVVFSGASIVGQTAADFNLVVMSRVVQGACAGLLQPLAMTVIYPVFPPEERGKAMGIFSMGVVMGPAIGPTIGGFIIDNADWRYVFSFALPFTMVATMLGARFLPGRDDSLERLKFNWLNFALVCTAVATMLTGISSGQREGWLSPYVVTLLLIAFVTALSFLLLEAYAKAPLVGVRVFSDRTFAISALVGFMFGAGMFGSIYLMPIFVQTVQGFTATKAGLLLLIAGLLVAVVFPIAGRIAGTIPSGYPMTLGLLMFGFSSLVLTESTVNSSFAFLALWATVGRVGLGLITPSLNIGAMIHLRPEILPYGAGALNFVRMFGGALGVNVIAVFLEIRTQSHGATFKAYQTSDNMVTQDLLRHLHELLARDGVVAIDATRVTMRFLSQTVAAKANMLAFQDAYMVLAWGFAAAACVAALLMRRQAPMDRP